MRFRFSLSGTWLTICNIIIKYNYASYFYSQNAVMLPISRTCVFQ
ncbi:hypothetical protein HMPREF1588_01797 [Escherichia coli 110957]|nr:hypothetical protein HMPREF1588_01797 [Escherichia coli 110957]